MDYEFLIKQKIEELEEQQNALCQMYNFYLKRKDFNSLDNITKQLYRNQYAVEILQELL